MAAGNFASVFSASILSKAFLSETIINLSTRII
jgi:hypothetical protein